MKGHTILVGVGKTNKMHYGIDNITPTATKSAKDILHFLKTERELENSKDDLFIGSQAIWNDVKIRLSALAELSQKEPIYLFFYFCGHGYNFKKKKDKTVTFLCFYDQMVFENELVNMFRKFSSNSQIFMVIDSCYAEGIATNKGFRKNKTFGLSNKKRKSFPELVRFYENKLQVVRDKSALPSIFFIASVGEEKWANTNGRNGMFTFSFYFLAALKKNKENNYNYQEFFEKLSTKFGPDKAPKLKDFKTNISYFKTNNPLKLKQL